MTNEYLVRKRTRLKFLHFAFCVLHFGALSVLANEIAVDKRALALDDSVTISITLTDSFANVDAIRVPLQNLVMEGDPAVSSEFQWINGQSSRRKVFRYLAHPAAAGGALIGPVVPRSSDGQVETLAPISVQVLPDAAAGTNDPARILRELLATGRDPIFLIAEADNTAAQAGQEVVVTWTLYNAASVQQYSVGQIPRLADFWTEELDVRAEEPQQALIAGTVLQKLVIRRAALFPLRSGTLQVEPMAVNAAILKRVNTGDPFGSIFEGVQVDVHRRSSPLMIDVRPLPPGPPPDVVGDVTLDCATPVQRNGGPVAVDVRLTGRANLRAAPPPQWEQPLDGSVQVIERGLSVSRSRGDATMNRRWQYLIFPANRGVFTLPPLVTTALTAAGARQQLRCSARTLVVEAADASARTPSPSHPVTPMEATRRAMPGIATAAGILLVIALAAPPLLRMRRSREEVRRLTGSTPGETKAAVDQWLGTRRVEPAALLRETSDRGDAYRALRSLLDALEHERIDAPPAELRARLRELVLALGS